MIVMLHHALQSAENLWKVKGKCYKSIENFSLVYWEGEHLDNQWITWMRNKCLEARDNNPTMLSPLRVHVWNMSRIFVLQQLRKKPSTSQHESQHTYKAKKFEEGHVYWPGQFVRYRGDQCNSMSTGSLEIDSAVEYEEMRHESPNQDATKFHAPKSSLCITRHESAPSSTKEWIWKPLLSPPHQSHINRSNTSVKFKSVCSCN